MQEQESPAAELVADYLKSILHYEPATGQFTWLTSRRKRLAGRPAGGLNSHGHVRITVDKREYGAHRLAWLYVTGELPKHDIDHINGNRADNRFVNLRLAPGGINQQNQRRPPRNNRLGVLGVRASRGRFRAAIKLNGRTHCLGTYDTAEAAHEAYVTAKRKLHEGNTL